MSLTENKAVVALMYGDRMRRNLCVPRYTHPNWFEADVFEVTKPGYFREYEVKLTLRDFKDDAKKAMEKQPRNWGAPQVFENKHEMLSKGDTRGPSQFWFVTPEGLIDQSILPPWAGLIELRDRDPHFRPSQRWVPVERVKAPVLHRKKISDQYREFAVGACYYRFHDLLRASVDNVTPPSTWPDNLENAHAVDQPMEVQFSEPFLPFSV